jgi:hypothetical protein
VLNHPRTHRRWRGWLCEKNVHAKILSILGGLLLDWAMGSPDDYNVYLVYGITFMDVAVTAGRGAEANGRRN